jgi:hypothetical protein
MSSVSGVSPSVSAAASATGQCQQVYEEQATGKNTGRPQLETCLKSLRESDTPVEPPNEAAEGPGE